MSDVLFAIRMWRRSPAFTLTAAITIALGIGASTAIFSVTDGVLLRPLPYKDPERLVIGYGDLRARANYGMPISTENYFDIRDGSTAVFEDMAAVSTGRQVLPADDGAPEQVRVAQVTTNFFRMMGANIALGRDFEEADGMPTPSAQPAGPDAAAPPTRPIIVVLSYDYWQRRFGGSRDILGRNFPGASRALTIVGVLSPRFQLLFPTVDNVERVPDIWMASRLSYNNANRNTYGLRPVARLKAGVTLEQAQANVEGAVSEIRRNFPLYATAQFYLRLEPIHETLVGDVRPAILALMGGVTFLLLIACANVANLLLVRASLREPELAVRAALGAGRWRVVRQLVVEALVLCAVGGTLAVALAWAGIRELVAIAPASLPRLDAIHIDPLVLAFAVAITLASAVLCGMLPAWTIRHMDPMHVLRGSGRTSGLARAGLLRNTVVVVEVALCFVLLIGSGLMVRSFLELQRVDPGFDPHGVLTFRLLGGRPRSSPAERAAVAREIETRLQALPGVERVTASFPFPLAGDFSTIRWGTEEALADNTRYQAVDWQMVRPGYFETLRTPLLQGRTFAEADNDPARNLVVVDQMLAAKAFPHESAVGKQIVIRIRTPEPERVEIIGVVAHQRVRSLAEAGREQMYVTDGFLGFGAPKWALRVAGDPARYARLVRGEIAQVDPQFLVTDLQPMDVLVRQAQAGTRFTLILIGTFAFTAALLGAVGLYGVLATVVRQRTSEIGVRMALGASPIAVLRLVLAHGLRLTASGLALGVFAAILLTRGMTTMLVGVTPMDPMTFMTMAIVFLLIAAVSCWVPARRAATMDPTAALREG
jgi:putative ABC transport system permease protein